MRKKFKIYAKKKFKYFSAFTLTEAIYNDQCHQNQFAKDTIVSMMIDETKVFKIFKISMIIIDGLQLKLSPKISNSHRFLSLINQNETYNFHSLSNQLPRCLKI
ncbi:LIM/homeobox protein LMX-1.2 [Sarcoptes scabiei]|nr:LIM/homeobox protein LMX-1.2 [Sarcoptes scabiei]